MLTCVATGFGATAGKAGTDVREELRRTLPKYDPNPSPPVAAEAPLKPKVGPRLTSIPPLREEPPAEPPPPLPVDADVIVLPAVRVEGKASRAPLPRASVAPAEKSVTIDRFATPEERTAKLVEKHLSAFDRLFLNRFTPFGYSKEARAADAEALEQNAWQLNEVADRLELWRASGTDPAEYERLKKLYLEAYHDRVK